MPRVDPEKGPDLETILRTLDTIIKHIQGRGKNRSPLRQTVMHGVGELITALIFEYPKFNLTKHECSRIDALIDTLAAEGKLDRGRRRVLETILIS